MTEVASLGLCKELYELSEWTDPKIGCHHFVSTAPTGLTQPDVCPAYSLGYLLRKLPSSIKSEEHPGKNAQLTMRKDEQDPDHPEKGFCYFAWYVCISDDPADFGEYADTPEDALCKLAISILKAKVIHD